jgi:hypothetical protein
MRTRLHPLSAIALVATVALAVYQRWSVQEVCWSVWLSGLVFSWAGIVVWVAGAILSVNAIRQRWAARVAFLGRIPSTVALLAMALISAALGWFAMRAIAFVFAFYALFLSFFAEMEPHAFFGRNGFINSDFYTPVMYLVDRFWPMVLATLVSSAEALVRKDGWRAIPRSMLAEIARMHILVLAMPVLTLVAWIFFRDNYGPAAAVLVILLLFAMPAAGAKSATAGPVSEPRKSNAR